MAEKVYGMHHIGITVPDIKQGIEFFKAIFGAVEVFHTGPFDVDANFMKGKLGAAPDSRIRDLVFLKCGEGTSVELFEYSGDDADKRHKRSSEVGGMHLCFEVDDVFASAERLKAQGVEMLEGPTRSRPGHSPASTGSISGRPGACCSKSRASITLATRRIHPTACGAQNPDPAPSCH